jgi:hypothetical protein
MKKKVDAKKLSLKVATVRNLRDGIKSEQLAQVAGGLKKTMAPSGTPDNC